MFLTDGGRADTLAAMKTPTTMLGKRIRSLRSSAKLTLVELSKLSGVALATLSRIETGRMTGTLESHMAIARALGTPLPDLYREVASETPLVIVQRKRQDVADRFFYGKGAAFEMLTSKVFAKRMMPLLLTLSPGRATQSEESQPGVEKFLYVMSGRVEARIGGESHRLSAGDALYFAAALPHHWRNPGTTAARCLSITSPPSL